MPAQKNEAAAVCAPCSLDPRARNSALFSSVVKFAQHADLFAPSRGIGVKAPESEHTDLRDAGALECSLKDFNYILFRSH